MQAHSMLSVLIDTAFDLRSCLLKWFNENSFVLLTTTACNKAKFENMEKQENKLIVHGFGNMIVPINYPDTPGDFLIDTAFDLRSCLLKWFNENSFVLLTTTACNNN
jgi:uncharacterized protein with WD repeat